MSGATAGPVASLVASLPAERVAALRRAVVDLVAPSAGPAGVRFSREYLLVVGRRRSAA